MTYPVAERTLRKWAASRLERKPAGTGYPDAAEAFTYTYDGSTCNNGGTPYRALLKVVVSGSGDKRTIRDARIVIPEDQKEAASEMCAAPGTGAADAEPFFEKLASPAEFTGRDLAEVIEEEVPQNFAGCFCGKPHINQKWKIVLATVHYTIFSGGKA